MNCCLLTLTLACIYPFLFSVECHSFPGGGECGLSGLSFGGRLLVANQDGMSSNQWDSRKAFIFRSPRRGRTSLGGHGGRGIIVIRESQSCRGPTTQQQGSCPARGSIPCMDSSIPCTFDFGPPPAPSYNNSTPLFQYSANLGGVRIGRPEWNKDVDNGEGPLTSWMIMHYTEGGRAGNITKPVEDLLHTFNRRPGSVVNVKIALMNDAGAGPFTEWQSFAVPCPRPNINLNLETNSLRPGFAKLKANWNYAPASGGCAIRNQTIRFKQLDMGDGCGPDDEVPDFTDDLQVVDDISITSKNRRQLNPNSLFNVTVTLVTMAGQEFYISNSTRTDTSAPTTGPAIGGYITGNGGRKKFTWSALQCGDRNADTLQYAYTIDVEGQTSLSVSGVSEKRNGVMKSRNTRRPVLGGQTYTFTVKAYSAKGESPVSTLSGTF